MTDSSCINKQTNPNEAVANLIGLENVWWVLEQQSVSKKWMLSETAPTLPKTLNDNLKLEINPPFGLRGQLPVQQALSEKKTK